MFRFCRRARFSPAAALKLLHATCQWRLTSGLLELTPASISSLYLSKPLFFFHPDLYDRFGRPCAVLNLKHVQRTEDGKLDDLKDYVRFGWEVARRYLSDLSRRAASTRDPTLQVVVIVDLDQAGMSNLVRPAGSSESGCRAKGLTRQLFLFCRSSNCCRSSWTSSRTTFPAWSEPVSLAAILVLASKHDAETDFLSHVFVSQSLCSTTAGRTPGCGSLPSASCPTPHSSVSSSRTRKSSSNSLTRITCLSVSLPLSFCVCRQTLISPPPYVTEHGGRVQYEYSPANPILDKYGKCQISVNGLSSPFTSRAPSRATSSSSLHHEVFHSAPGSGAGTPSLSRKPSGLMMTMARDDSEAAEPATPPPTSSWFSFGRGSLSGRTAPTADSSNGHAGGAGDMTPRGIRRVRSLAELQQRLEQTQREIDSDDSIDDSGSDTGTYDFDGRGADTDGGAAPSGYSTTTTVSTVASTRSSRYSSRVGSRVVSREGSPNRPRRAVEPLTPASPAARESKALELEVLVSRSDPPARAPHPPS